MPLQSEHGQPSPPPFAPHQPRQSLFAIRNSPIPRLSWRPWLPWRPSPPCRCRSPGVLGDLGALAVHSLGSGGQPDFFPPSLPRFARHAAIAPPSRPVQRPPRTPHPHPPHLPRSPTNPRSNPHAAPFAIPQSSASLGALGFLGVLRRLAVVGLLAFLAFLAVRSSCLPFLLSRLSVSWAISALNVQPSLSQLATRNSELTLRPWSFFESPIPNRLLPSFPPPHFSPLPSRSVLPPRNLRQSAKSADNAFAVKKR